MTAGGDILAGAAAFPIRAEPATHMTVGAIYSEYFRFVWRSVRRLGVSEAAAEDVVQEVFVIVHRRLHAYEPRASVRAWLFGIVRGVVRNHRRAVRRIGCALGVATEAHDELPDRPSRPGPHECAMKAEAVRVLYELLDELDDDKREVFVLAELEQLTAPEIADAVNQKLNTVYSRLRAARRDFDEAVARRKARDARRST